MQVFKLKKNLQSSFKNLLKGINEINNIHSLYFTEQIQEKYKTSEKIFINKFSFDHPDLWSLDT